MPALCAVQDASLDALTPKLLRPNQQEQANRVWRLHTFHWHLKWVHASIVTVQQRKFTWKKGGRLAFRHVCHQGHCTFEVRAVVLAAGAINSPQLWLKSGLPNANRRVGKNLHLHPAVFVGGIFEEMIDGHLGIPQSYYIDEFLDLRRAPDSGYLLMPAFGSEMIVATSLPGFGSSHQKLMERYRHIAALLVLLHDRTTGRVSINYKGAPSISYRLQRSDKQVLVEGIMNAARLLFAAGATEIVMPYTEHLPIKTEADLEIIRHRGIVPHDIILASSHPQGTLQMGEDRHKAVVKLSGESHAVSGLFVADASLFPSLCWNTTDVDYRCTRKTCGRSNNWEWCCVVGT